MDNITKIVYALRIVDKNSEIKSDAYINLSNPTGFDNVGVQEFLHTIKTKYIEKDYSVDPYKSETYWKFRGICENISIDFIIGELDGSLENFIKPIYKLISFNANDTYSYFPPTSSEHAFKRCLETWYHSYPEIINM